MIARRILRTALRRIKRVVRPLRLRWIVYMIECSDKEIKRLQEMREDTITLERNECQYQVQMAVRKIELELG